MKFNLTDKIHIRSVLSSDWEDLVRLEREIAESDQDQDTVLIEKRNTLLLEKTLLVEEEGDILAYLIAQELLEKARPTPFDQVPLEPGTYLAVVSLKVRPAYRKQGYGSLLLASLKQVVLENKMAGILLACPEDCLDYFRMNGFVFEEVLSTGSPAQDSYIMKWKVEHDDSTS